MPICSKCQSISTVSICRSDWNGKIIYTHDADSLAQAVAANCFFCTQLWNSISEESRNLVCGSPLTGIECHIVPLDSDSTLLLKFDSKWKSTNAKAEDFETNVCEFLLVDDMVLSSDLSSQGKSAPYPSVRALMSFSRNSLTRCRFNSPQG
jgi:hypothetical protein